MFDPGFTEVILLFVIALLILGPERLPRVASQIGRWVGRARRTASQLRHQLEREAALHEMTKSRPKPKPRERPDASTSETEAAGSATGAAAGDESAGAHGPTDGSGDEGGTSPRSAAGPADGAGTSEEAAEPRRKDESTSA